MQADFRVLSSAMVWGDDVEIKQLFEPDWKVAKIGDEVSIVVDVHCLCEGQCLAVTCPGNQLVRIGGVLPASVAASSRLTLIRTKVVSHLPVVGLQIDSSCRVFQHAPLPISAMTSVVEVCSGLAAASIGFQRSGFSHVASVEWQPALVGLHQCIHPKIPVIQGDVQSSDVICQLWDTCGPFGTLMAGISCQPYSSGGSQAGGGDERATTLPSVLRMLHLLQARVLVIECVSQAQANVYVRQHLKCLHEELGFHINEITVRLEECWTANRLRWWMVASHANLGVIHLQPMPTGNRLVVRDLMPYLKDWPEDEEAQLRLSAHETAMFEKYGPIRKHLLKWDSKLPTSLHSWGNQLQACECGCRQAGFSSEMLDRRGIFSQIVPTKKIEDERIVYRHLHCKEVALLNGMPPEQQWSQNQRLNLCGQLASPLQSVWIATSVMQHLQSLLGESCIDQLATFHALKRELLDQASRMFAVPALKPSSITLVDWLNEGVASTILLRQPVTVQDLLQVEGVFRNESLADCCIADSTTGQVLEPTTVLSSGTFELRKYASVTEALVLALEDKPMTLVAAPPEDPGESFDEFPLDDEISTNGLGVMVPAVLTLTSQQLLGMLPPLVCDAALCFVMRNQTIPHYERVQILENQELLWADDEITWHATQCILRYEHGDVGWMDPLLATSWAVQPSQHLVNTFISELGQVRWILTAVLRDGHWTPVVFCRRTNTVNVHVWEYDDVPIAHVQALGAQVCMALQIPTYTLSRNRRSIGQNLCGAATIAFFDSMLNQVDLPRSEASLRDVHVQGKAVFKAALVQSPVSLKPWCWGSGPVDVQAMLSAVLKLHGVPEAQVASRVRLVLQSLGRDSVQKALASDMPWKQLKQLANQHDPVVQLVLHDEQRVQISNRDTNKKNKSGTKSSASRPPTVPVHEIDATKLTLLPGSFRVGNDEVVPQLALSQVSPVSVGVAITSFSEAVPFLRSGQCLTHQGLALLVINQPSDFETRLQWSTLRFAAKCSVNGEPVLMSGVLVQLGKQAIYQFCNHTGFQVTTQPVACARVTAYRDQWNGSWETFQSQPVKQLLSLLMPLLTGLQRRVL